MDLSDKLLRIDMTTKKFFNPQGSSLIEIIITVSIFTTLITITTLSLLNVRSKTSVNTALSTFITDAKNQQIKSMTGDTEGRGVPDIYSIYIQPESYTLFYGSNYSPGDPENFMVKAPDGYLLSTTFPLSTVTFASGSGEITNYINGQNSIIFTETLSGTKKVIQLNQYGAVVSIN